MESNRYKVWYKLKGSTKTETFNYIWNQSTSSLIKHLDTEDKINTQTVEFLFVHNIFPDGKVKEVYAYGENESVLKDSKEDSPFKKVKEAIDRVYGNTKPSVTLKNTKVGKPYKVHALGLYKSQEAEAHH